MSLRDKLFRIEGEHETTKAQRRAAGLPTYALPDWADQCLYEVGRALSDFRREASVDSLAEAQLAAETLAVILKEMEVRRSSMS